MFLAPHRRRATRHSQTGRVEAQRAAFRSRVFRDSWRHAALGIFVMVSGNSLDRVNPVIDTCLWTIPRLISRALSPRRGLGRSGGELEDCPAFASSAHRNGKALGMPGRQPYSVQETVDQYMEASRKYRERIRNNPEEAKQFLIRAGIMQLNKNRPSGIELVPQLRDED